METDSHTTFEEYISPNGITEERCRVLREMNQASSIPLEMFLHFARLTWSIRSPRCEIEEETSLASKQKSYSAMFFTLLEAKITHNSPELVTRILRAMYSVDILCGNSEILDPHDAPAEHTRKIRIMDADRDKFRRNVIAGIKSLSESQSAIDYFIDFCKLLFEFNGYQAPYRHNVRDALRDTYDYEHTIEEFFKECAILAKNA